jgi:hypothetical protein
MNRYTNTIRGRSGKMIVVADERFQQLSAKETCFKLLAYDFNPGQ